MTNWIEWNGGECPIKSYKTIVEYRLASGLVGVRAGRRLDWTHSPTSLVNIIAYRITEDHEPMTRTREQITAQIAELQKQLDAMPVVVGRGHWDGSSITNSRHVSDTHYFDIETINGVPHIHGVAMKELTK